MSERELVSRKKKNNNKHAFLNLAQAQLGKGCEKSIQVSTQATKPRGQAHWGDSALSFGLFFAELLSTY